MRKYFSAEECAAKKQKTTVRHFGFTEKYTDFRARFAQCYCGSAIIGMPSCVFRFLRGAIVVEARRRRAASARYIYRRGVENGCPRTPRVHATKSP